MQEFASGTGRFKSPKPLVNKAFPGTMAHSIAASRTNDFQQLMPAALSINLDTYEKPIDLRGFQLSTRCTLLQ